MDGIMGQLLGFFSDLILFTAGIVVVLMWIAFFIALGIEVWDSFHEKDVEEEEDF